MNAPQAHTRYRRWGSRKEIRIDAALVRRGKGAAQGTLKNFGLGGAFIELGEHRLVSGMEVVLGFQIDNINCSEHFHLPAVVAHTQVHGVGLQFIGHEKTVARALRGLVCEMLLRNQRYHLAGQ